MPLISDAMVQAAFDYLNESGDNAAQAKADRYIAEHRRKAALSKLILGSKQKTSDMRRAEAEASDGYMAACEVEAEAIRADEWHRLQRMRAEATIEAFRTEQANMRGLRKIG